MGFVRCWGNGKPPAQFLNHWPNGNALLVDFPNSFPALNAKFKKKTQGRKHIQIYFVLLLSGFKAVSWKKASRSNCSSSKWESKIDISSLALFLPVQCIFESCILIVQWNNQKYKKKNGHIVFWNFYSKDRIWFFFKKILYFYFIYFHIFLLLFSKLNASI